MVKQKKKIQKEEKVPRKVRNKEESYTRVAVIFMIALIISLIFFYFFIKSMNKFEYRGIEFEKQKNGNTIFYVGQMLLKNALPLTVYFREDPRKLEGIKSAKIILTEEVALAFEPEVFKCDNSILAGATLSQYLSKGFSFKPYAASINKTDAENNKIKYVRCGPFDSNSVIVFKKANETAIREDNNCYILEFANCEMLNVTEKFMIDLYNYMNA